jgi:hypothetical protein
MKFDDLPDAAKARAREQWREHELDTGWWDDTYRGAMEVGALMGCEIGDSVSRTVGGKSRSDPDIWFRGFSSQGDGACWSGYLDTGRLAGAVARVKDYAPQDEDLHALAVQAEALHGVITAVQVANRLSQDDPDWPDVEIGMRIIVDSNERYYCTKVDTSLLPGEIEEAANQFVDGFASWIYHQLEAEYDWRLDDQQIDEAIRASGREFYGDGNEL